MYIYLCVCLCVCVCARTWVCCFPGGAAVKNLPANAGDVDSTLGSGRSPWKRKWQPLSEKTKCTLFETAVKQNSYKDKQSCSNLKDCKTKLI